MRRMAANDIKNSFRSQAPPARLSPDLFGLGGWGFHWRNPIKQQPNRHEKSKPAARTEFLVHPPSFQPHSVLSSFFFCLHSRCFPALAFLSDFSGFHVIPSPSTHSPRALSSSAERKEGEYGRRPPGGVRRGRPPGAVQGRLARAQWRMGRPSHSEGLVCILFATFRQNIRTDCNK